MNRYYVEYPRDFCNEYTVYVVASGLVQRFEKVFPNAYSVTRKDAIRLGITRPKEAKRDNEQWWGGFPDGSASCTADWRKLTTVPGRLEIAAKDTEEELDRRETEAAAIAEYQDSLAE